MSLSDFANVVISTEGPALTQVGFGTILLAAYHTKFAERTRTYDSLTAVAEDFDSWEPAYLMAQAAFAQDPRVSVLKIGRCALPFTQTIRLTPTITTVGYVYSVKVQVADETVVTVSYTVVTSDTVALIIDGLKAAIDALAYDAIATVDDTTHLTVNVDQGVILYLSEWPAGLKYDDRTPDPGIATDLDAIRLADPDWYGFDIDIQAKSVQEEAADWAETQLLQFATTTSDWLAPDSGQTTDIGDVLQGKSYGRSVCLFSLNNPEEYRGVRMLADRFSMPPGSDTWHGKTLAGATPDALTTTQKVNLRAKNYVVYITTAGINHTLDGKTAGGEFADQIRGLDWLKVRTEERITAAELAQEKIPYNAKGIAILEAQVRAQLKEGVDVGFLNPGFTVTALPAEDANPADKANRRYRGLAASAQLAGAIHLVDPISFTITN